VQLDDVVSSFAVHGVAGIIGTILIGVFSTENGLLYGGGFTQLSIQSIGALSVALWAIIVSFSVISILKYTVGIRVTLEQEIAGLDNSEHNLEYAEESSKTTIDDTTIITDDIPSETLIS